MKALMTFTVVLIPAFCAFVGLVLFAISPEPKKLILALVLGAFAALGWMFVKGIFGSAVSKDGESK